MSALATELSRQLPLLRRFSRAVAGSQKSGDAYVAALLKALIDAPDMLGGVTRSDLYRGLLRLWNSVALNRQGDAGTTAADDRLQGLAPRARQAFLLVTVEEFSIVEAAHILELGLDEFRGLVEEATVAIAAELSSDVLIIEDEPLIAHDLKQLVGEAGHRVIGIARTHRDAVRLAGEHSPDIVLADVQLADGSSGIGAVEEILATLRVPVVFVTAYPERLLTGEAPEPAFIISKPFDPVTLKAVISQALFFNQPVNRQISSHAVNALSS